MEGTGSVEGLGLYRKRFLAGPASMSEAAGDVLARDSDFVRFSWRRLAGRGDWSPWLAEVSDLAGRDLASLDALLFFHSLLARAVTSAL